MVMRSAAPPPPPSMVYGPGCPPSYGMECGFSFPPVGWLWGFLGFWVYFKLFNFGLKGTRLQVDKGIGRVWGVGSLGLIVYAWFTFRVCI